jgi:hypothetical protein
MVSVILEPFIAASMAGVLPKKEDEIEEKVTKRWEKVME